MTTATMRSRTGQSDAPFLVWPVARREFYTSICLAMTGALGWGMVIFGWRVLVMTIAAVLSAFLVHALLRRFTERGKYLLFSHTLLLTMLLVSLSHPQWPAWIVAAVAAIVPVISWALGGPGRERIHPTLALVVLMSLCVTPMVDRMLPESGGAAAMSDAILARNRLFMGDIRNHHDEPTYYWPRAIEINGDDAVGMLRPDEAARNVLNRISEDLSTANLTAEGGVAPGAAEVASIRKTIDDALVMQLPSMEQLLVGAFPGQVGTVCFIGIILGGLYLAYRNILRFRSAAFFLAVYLIVQLATLLSPGALAHLKFWGIWYMAREFAAELVTLWSYSVISGDACFAAVFVLALPGTEPLSRPGRRAFLVVAATGAALLHRAGLPAPAATTALTALMPFRGLFDTLFHPKSWLDR